MLHFVEPHSSDFERISIAFNNSFRNLTNNQINADSGQRLTSCNDVLELEVDSNTGNLDFPK